MEIERKTITTGEIKSVSDEGVLSGYGAIFGNVDLQGDVIAPGAFKDTLHDFISDGYLIADHSWDRRIGTIEKAHEDSKGLFFEAKFHTTAVAQELKRVIRERLDRGKKVALSIGYKVLEDSPLSKGVRELRKLKLFEISVVTVGANSLAMAVGMKADVNNTDTSTLEVKNMSAEVAEDYSQQFEQRLKALEAEKAKPIRPNFGGKPMGQGIHEVKSLGEAFAESREFQNWLGSKSMESSQFLSDVRLKTLTTTGTPSGWPVENVRSPVIIPFPTRSLRAADLLPHIETTQNSYVYLEETTFTNAAIEIAENAPKPGSDLALSQKTSPVQKIACWLAATDEQLDDVVGVADYINSRLAHMVALRLDQQILTGNGTAPNLRGILNVVGIQTTAKAAGEPISDAVARAINLVRSTGMAEPNAIIMHPNNWVTVQTLRTVDGLYISGGPWSAGPATLWNIPVVISSAITENVALVGDFANFSQLAERQRITVKVGFASDDFLSNRKSFVGETRVAVVWYRPQAFCTVTALTA